jgi:Fur family ferric uptake transcriptional regulator
VVYRRRFLTLTLSCGKTNAGLLSLGLVALWRSFQSAWRISLRRNPLPAIAATAIVIVAAADPGEIPVSLPAVAVSQTPENKFREYLASRPKPQRFTEQQRELLAHVFARHSHFDVEQLLENLKSAGKHVSRATVYRTLSKLVDAGLLRRIELGSRTVFDHDYGYPAHDHLVCEECGKMIEFQSEGVDAAIREIVGKQNFRANGRSLVIRGVCAECNAARAMKRRLVM